MTLQQKVEENILLFFVFELLLVIFVIGIFFVFREMERLQEDKMQAALLHQQNRAQELFYKESIDKNKQLKKIIHDEKNFLIGISGLLKQKKIDFVIEEIEQKVEQLVSNTTDYTGNIALDTILTTKVEEARALKITLRPAIALYGNINVDFLDLVLILGNALGNAIEAAKQVAEQEQCVIYMTMKLQENFLSIEVRNPIKERVLIENNRVQTTKEDRLMHGLGLGNI